MMHPPNDESIRDSGDDGVCLMSTKWRDEQDSSLIEHISCFLTENSFRLNIVSIAPDLVFKCGGLSVAFNFVTNYDCNNPGPMFSRAQKLKTQFAHLYVVVILPSAEQNKSFVRSYFRYGMDIGRPTFVPVVGPEMGFEKIVRIALARGEGKGSQRFVDVFRRVVTSIPGLDRHDAIVLDRMGSLETIAKASVADILEDTDLSWEKANTISTFFKRPQVLHGTQIYLTHMHSYSELLHFSILYSNQLFKTRCSRSIGSLLFVIHKIFNALNSK